MSLVDSLGRSATVATLEESHLAWMDREEFWECLRMMPRLVYNLHGLLAQRVRLSNTHIEALGSLDVAGRVARHLLALATEYGREVEGGTAIPIPLVQSDLAAMVGASRVRVNQVLGNFRRRRFISVDRATHQITVHDPEALRKRCR
jgi:CRP/FNR family transcriptional regulator, cyclic AMP receptor protein